MKRDLICPNCNTPLTLIDNVDGVLGQLVLRCYSCGRTWVNQQEFLYREAEYLE